FSHAAQILFIADDLGRDLSEPVQVFWNRAIVFVEKLQTTLPNLFKLPSFFGIRLARYSTKGGRIEIVICKNNVSKTQFIELIDFLNDFFIEAQTGQPSFRDPHGTETTVLRTTGHRLNGRKQILGRVDEIPTCCEHVGACHPPS